METRIDEIADGIYRLSTYMAEVAPPAGFTFNQFLVKADQPLLFHYGMRGFSRWCRARSRRSCRWTACAGSRSGTSKPTNAAR